ncbi:hypothetical protein GALMADRAFT_247597 [Galerina marginata CBS 339.88]|uniref:MYND-type domain-containing protein n=1 Tax=Galerina marginata (strain CBS 339.88) TaxID=685588 RepID=A0A067T8P2_GALM3|nr:hypothetical protein GALMADRAFT_247597 [Galerina marginata CBS 339.88]
MSLQYSRRASEPHSGNGDGGLIVTQEMKDILAAEPGFLKAKKGGQRLRHLYVNGSLRLDPGRFSPFAQYCFIGEPNAVRQEVEAGRAPDLEGTETPYKFGYATLIVAGAQRILTSGTRHMDVLKYLISLGLLVDVPDIVGFTALFHAIASDAPKLDLARALLEAGSNVNYQNRYGEVPLFGAFMKRSMAGLDLLMEFGANLDIAEADGMTPRKEMLSFGPETTAIVQKWVRRRAGEEAPMVEKRCDHCQRTDAPLKNCGRCHAARYCSTECQRKAWSGHKQMCMPFSASNTLAFKPFYEQNYSLQPNQEIANKVLGINTPTPEAHRRGAHVPKRIDSESKNLIIKVQVPYDITTKGALPGGNPLLVYTKKRDFVCHLKRPDKPAAYDQLSKIIVEKGVGGGKAYFAAELKSRDELIVKVSEVLAEQPF